MTTTILPKSYSDSCTEAKRLLSSGLSRAEAAHALNANGYPTKTGKAFFVGKTTEAAALKAGYQLPVEPEKSESAPEVETPPSPAKPELYRGPSKRALESLQLTWGDLPPAIRSEIKADLLAHLLGGAA